VKELLYRPPKIRELYEKYWDLNKANLSRVSGEKLMENTNSGRRSI